MQWLYSCTKIKEYMCWYDQTKHSQNILNLQESNILKELKIKTEQFTTAEFLHKSVWRI